MRAVLLAAAAYNVLWGGLVILFPFAVFDVLGMERPNYPQIWQCIGMIVGVYGVGYAAAALDPLRHWPVVLVGLLGKVFGPIGFLSAVVGRTLPLSFGLTILTNDLIWWLPFALILLRAYQSNETPRGANA
jgi:small multidrug resistance pump